MQFAGKQSTFMFLSMRCQEGDLDSCLYRKELLRFYIKYCQMKQKQFWSDLCIVVDLQLHAVVLMCLKLLNFAYFPVTKDFNFCVLSTFAQSNS